MTGRAGRVVALVTVLVASATLLPRSAPSMAVSPTIAYLDTALDYIQTHAYYADRVHWAAVRANLVTQADRATAPAGTYPEIEQALSDLGDHHSGLDLPQPTTSRQDLTTLPTYSIPTGGPLPGRLSVLNLPHIATMSTPVAQDYVNTAQRVITSAAQARCWIVDLRTNIGGNVYPMLTALAPLLAPGRVMGFHFRSGADQWLTSTNGVITRSGTGIAMPGLRASLRVPGGPPPIAVLTGPRTGSSGEAVAAALRGRAATRSFGAPTIGVPTGRTGITMPDGLDVEVVTALDLDTAGHLYDSALDPDVPVTGPTPGTDNPTDPVIAAASRWLHALRKCTAGLP